MKLFDVYPLFDVNIVKAAKFGTIKDRSIWTCMAVMPSSR